MLVDPAAQDWSPLVGTDVPAAVAVTAVAPEAEVGAPDAPFAEQRSVGLSSVGLSSVGLSSVGLSSVGLSSVRQDPVVQGVVAQDPVRQDPVVRGAVALSRAESLQPGSLAVAGSERNHEALLAAVADASRAVAPGDQARAVGQQMRRWAWAGARLTAATPTAATLATATLATATLLAATPTAAAALVAAYRPTLTHRATPGTSTPRWTGPPTWGWPQVARASPVTPDGQPARSG